MIRFLSCDGSRVVALRAIGKLTHGDYHATILPRLERALAEDGKLLFIGVLGHDYEGMTPHAVWDDLKFDVAHRRDFERLAIVSDHLLVRTAVRVFGPLFSGEVRLFALQRLHQAEQWLLDGILTKTWSPGAGSVDV